MKRGSKKGYPTEEGPIIRQLEKTLREFNVARQAYYGGTFVGNHVHRSLKVMQGILIYSILLRHNNNCIFYSQKTFY